MAYRFKHAFLGNPEDYMPCEAVMAIYARENGAGTVFATEEDVARAQQERPETSEDVSQPIPTSLEDADASDVKDAPVPPKKGAHLKVVTY